MKKVKFIYNPNSGDKSIVDKIDLIIDIHQQNDIAVVPYRLGSSSIEDIFANIDETYKYILIAGGDGTVDIIVNHMKKNDINMPIAILPTGTANDFAKVLGFSQNIEVALKNIIKSNTNKVDLGKINDKYFVNVASAGMFTDVSQNINTNFKNTIGKLSYYIKGIEQALRMKKFSISIKSEEVCYEGDMYLMLVFNGRTAGNINLAYKSELNDGLLDVILFKAMPMPKTLPLILKVMKGEHLENQEDILYFKTKEVFIDCKEVISTDIDGEKGPNFPLTITCEINSIEVLMDNL